ncbi:sulfotransferase family 2 domain-containing protein [Alcanivorax sp.]|uniref:sulfotransferase family 2 domain-containing protein n=1 Tax=Alcanivorax sp. TaxID=1872427 RepID=UPI003A95240F
MDLKKKINLYRRKRYWLDNECIFIHVPKVAGTSINKALYGRTLGHYSAEEINRAFPRLYDRAFTFSLVRNPWSRIYSAYKFACVGRTSSMGIHDPKQYQIAEFETFERFLLEWLPEQDLSKVDYVFRRQSDFVCWNDGTIAVDFLGKVESIESDMGFVSKKIGRRISVARENSTAGKGFDYRLEYKNREMIELVQNVYSVDVDNFRYEFN